MPSRTVASRQAGANASEPATTSPSRYDSRSCRHTVPSSRGVAIDSTRPPTSGSSGARSVESSTTLISLRASSSTTSASFAGLAQVRRRRRDRDGLPVEFL